MSYEKRILAIDNDIYRVRKSAIMFRDLSRNILIRDTEPFDISSYIEKFRADYDCQLDIGGEETIKRAFSEETYRLVLLDGNLNLGLEGQFFDGAVVARKLRHGEYGEKNIQTPILSISSISGVIPQAKGSIILDYLSESNAEREARRLLDEFK